MTNQNQWEITDPRKLPCRTKRFDEESAGGFVFRSKNNKIFIALIKDSYNKWTFAKGHLEQRETPKQAALAEIKEESGIKELRIINQIGTLCLKVKPRGKKTQPKKKLVHVFLAETKNPYL